MKILITGGAGFIGSHVTRYLLAKGHTLTILDTLSTGKRDNVPNCTFIEADIREFEPLEEAMEGIDVVIHLAALVSAPESVKQPELARFINELGSQNVLRAAHEAKVKKVVLASSAAVYGIVPETPTKEEHQKEPATPYAETKLRMEEHAQKYLDAGIETCCLRFFNVYGPGQDPKSSYAAVIPAFITRALNNKPLVIYGDGEQTRDFIYVEDIARALEMALTKGIGEFNIATGTEVSLNTLAELIISLAGSESITQHAEAREGDPRTSHADTTKAKEELGFEATTRLEEGLQKTIEYFRSGKA